MRIKGAARDLVAEYVEAQAAAAAPLSQTAVAAQIGVPRTTLDAALRTARAEGDPRLADKPPSRSEHLEDLHVQGSASVHQLHDEDLAKAVRVVHRHAFDVDDAAQLLDALGLGGDAA